MPRPQVMAVDRTHAPDSGGKAIRSDSSPESRARRLQREIVELRGEVLLEGGEIFDRWRPGIHREEFLPSARNLAHYLALRRHDLRDLQVRLMPWGLSSLGRCEARVLPTLNAVAAALAALGSEGGPEAEPDTEAFFRGHELLGAHTEAMLGPTPPNRAVRIMVTLPSQAAHAYELVQGLVSGGMDVARINCAHDDSAAWAQMAEHLRRAARETGRSCRICFDLVGPRARVASTTVSHEGRVHLGDRILMTSGPTPGAIAVDAPIRVLAPRGSRSARRGGGSVRERGSAGCRGRAPAGRRAPAASDGGEGEGRAPARGQGAQLPRHRASDRSAEPPRPERSRRDRSARGRRRLFLRPAPRGDRPPPGRACRSG